MMEKWISAVDVVSLACIPQMASISVRDVGIFCVRMSMHFCLSFWTQYFMLRHNIPDTKSKIVPTLASGWILSKYLEKRSVLGQMMTTHNRPLTRVCRKPSANLQHRQLCQVDRRQCILRWSCHYWAEESWTCQRRLQTVDTGHCDALKIMSAWCWGQSICRQTRKIHVEWAWGNLTRLSHFPRMDCCQPYQIWQLATQSASGTARAYQYPSCRGWW